MFRVVNVFPFESFHKDIGVFQWCTLTCIIIVGFEQLIKWNLILQVSSYLLRAVSGKFVLNIDNKLKKKFCSAWVYKFASELFNTHYPENVLIALVNPCTILARRYLL